MSLPVHQVCKGQPRPAELLIQPDTEVMQRDLCRQTGPKPAELMRALPVQAKGMKQLVVDRLDDLTDSCPPATPETSATGILTIPLGRTEDLSSIGLPPPTAWFARPSKPLSTTYGPRAGAPTLGTRGWGARRRAKKVSASGWSLVLAAPKAKPVITPTGLTAINRWNPS